MAFRECGFKALIAFLLGGTAFMENSERSLGSESTIDLLVRTDIAVDGGLSKPLPPTILLPPGFDDHVVFSEELEEFLERADAGGMSLELSVILR